MKIVRRATASLSLIVMLIAALVLPAASAGAQTVESDVAYEVLSDGTNEPLALDIAPDGRIVWIERLGTVNVMTPEGVRVVAGVLPVSANPTFNFNSTVPPAVNNGDSSVDVYSLEEGGLHGILLAPDFKTSNRVYLYYSVKNSRNPKTGFGLFRLSTFVLDPSTNLLDLQSEKKILDVPVEWDHCCHYGGDLDLLPDGTITLTTGDDVPASASGGYGPRDHRNTWTNGELSSANPADRRGKILRLMPDGSVPDGSVEGIKANPFLGMEGYNPYITDDSGTPDDGWIAFDPYVYSLGWKQPWRAVVHPETGTMYVSDIGPDASLDDPARGPRGFEEINRVPAGGGTHAGWPRCAGPNWAYKDVNWETMQVGDDLDCSTTAPVARPIGSTEPTVRGMTGADLYYPSGACDGSQNDITTYDCDRWPILGTGGKTSEPVAFYPAETKGALRLPERYNDRLFVLEWSRNYMLTIPYNEDGSLVLDNDKMSIVTPPNTFASPDTDNPYGTASARCAIGLGVSQCGVNRFNKPVDAKVGPDGALYFLEYGVFFYAGANGRLARLRCAACTPANPARNYGLPVGGATSAASDAAGVPGLPGRQMAIVTSIVGTAILAAGVRRRRQIV